MRNYYGLFNSKYNYICIVMVNTVIITPGICHGVGSAHVMFFQHFSQSVAFQGERKIDQYRDCTILSFVH